MKIPRTNTNLIKRAQEACLHIPRQIFLWAKAARWRQALLVVSIPALILVTVIATRPAYAGSYCTNSCAPSSAGAGSGWTSSGSITAQDGAYATNSVSSGGTSATLVGNTFGFSLPSGTSAITGIQVVIWEMAATAPSHNTLQDSTVELQVGGVASGTNLYRNGVNWTTTNTAYTYGGSTNTWGNTLTYSQVNATNFGVELIAKNVHSAGTSSAIVADVDYISMEVWYTVPPLLTQSAFRFYSNSAASYNTGYGDGATWVAPKSTGDGWSFRYGLSSIVWNNKIWVMGGYDNSSSYKNDVWYSSNGTTWTEATTGAAWSARFGATLLVYNNELWLVGGFDGTNPDNDVWYTTDGANWTEATASAFSGGARQMSNGFVYGGAMYVMGGLGASSIYKADVYSSTNGSTWTQVTSSAWGGVGRMMFGAGVIGTTFYVWGGVGSAGNLTNVWCSTNSGSTWSDSSTANTCGSGLQGTTSAAFPGRFGQSSVIYNNEMWVMAGDGSSSELNDVWYSSNGSTWTEATGSALFTARQEGTEVVYDNQMWYMGGWDGTYFYNDVIYSDGSGENVGVGTGLAANDTNITSPGDGNPFQLAIDLAVSQGKVDQREIEMHLQYASLSGSCSASTYSDVSDTTPIRFYNTNYPNALNAENLVNSNLPTDGNTLVPEEYWQQGMLQFRSQNSIPVGETGVWDFALETYRTQPGTTYCFRVATNADAAINGYTYYPEITTPSTTVTDSNYRFFGSQDAPNTASAWTSAGTFAATGEDDAAALVYNSVAFLMGGYNGTSNLNTVYCSTNGSSWTTGTCGSYSGTSSAAWSARHGMGAAVFDGAMFITGNSSPGTNGDVWCSTNGSTWSDTGTSTCGSGLQGTSSAAFPDRFTPKLLVFNNKLWLMEGSSNTGFNYNDVWCSTNGSTWSDTTCGTTAAPWTGRSQGAAWVFDNKMCIGGGISGSIYFNDVWCSPDGTNWTEETASANWTARYGLTGAVHDGLMWVYGGFDGVYDDDAWYSSDGVNWTRETTAATGTGRWLPMSMTFNDKLWILGGVRGSGGYGNEVYDYSFGGIDVGAPLTSQNHPLDLFTNPSPDPGSKTQPFRLRWDINVGGASQSANTTAYFNLQYAAMSGGSCSSTPSGNFANVTSSTPIEFYSTYTHATDGMPMMFDANDPTDGSNTISYQQFIDSSNPFTNNQLLIGGNEDGIWDFSLALGSSAQRIDYCLRIYNSSLTTSYNEYAQVEAAPQMPQLLAHRAWWNSSGVKMQKDIK
jgi:Kelch motif